MAIEHEHDLGLAPVERGVIEREAHALLAIAAAKLEILAAEVAKRCDAPAAGWRMLFAAKTTIPCAVAAPIVGIALDAELQARVIGELSPS